jgi:Ricin-type beta-trefoil lectin domain
MSPIKSIIVIILALSCIFTSVSSLALSSTSLNLSSTAESSISSFQSSSSASSQQVELVEKLPDGKKQLKKQLSLDYTNSKFETDLTQAQKDAILKSLKKWKGELPVDNTFTVTSIADLKSDTKDDQKQSKKKDKKTQNALVVYMWASTPNNKWDNTKKFEPEDYEAGDPRFNRTEFNVLLKQDKSSWKASIERDAEVKKDSESITESQEDQKVYQDLFGTNKVDNLFTSTLDILLDSDISSSSQSHISNMNSSLIDSSLAINTFSQSSSNSANFSSSSQIQNNPPTSSKKMGFLEKLLSFGSISAKAQDMYSWPWKSGDTWTALKTRDDGKCRAANGYSNSVNGWHGCGEYSGSDGNGSPSLDMFPPASQNYTNAYIEIKAPISGTLNRVCVDSQNVSAAILNMRILHLSTAEFVGSTTQGVSVTKSQKIGKVATQDSLGYGYGGTFNGSCGSSNGIHTHIKFINNGLNIDGQQIWHYGDYNSFTSQNSSTPIITDPNITTVLPSQQNYMKTLDFGCKTADGSPVFIYDRFDNDCQKMRYNSNNYTITNKYGKCLDGGDLYSSNNRWLRFSSCTNGNNQKWLQENGGRIWSFQANQYNKVMCIDLTGLNNNNIVNVNPCGSSANQLFHNDLYITKQSIPWMPGVWMFKQKTTATTVNPQCLNAYGTNGIVISYKCNTVDLEQLWENFGDGGFRNKSNGRCVNSLNPANNQSLTTIACDNNNSSLKWDYYAERMVRRGSSQCMNLYNKVNNAKIDTWGCSGTDPDQKWFAEYMSN